MSDLFKTSTTVAKNAPAPGNKPPEHPRLKAAIARLAGTAAQVDRVAMYRVIHEGMILFIHKDPLKMIRKPNGELSPDPEAIIQVRVVNGADGSQGIIAFTDIGEIVASYGSEGYEITGMNGLDFLDWALDGGYGGIVLNPAGPSAWIPNIDVPRILAGEFEEKPSELEFTVQQKPAAKKPVPKLPQAIQAAFERLLATTPNVSLTELKTEFQQALKTLSAQNDHLGVDRKLVKELASRSQFLLEQYPKLGKDDKILALSAVRYFVSNEDATPDDKALCGLDDDVKVMNYVLERLGCADRKITTYDD